jgi:hypothetical protein
LFSVLFDQILNLFVIYSQENISPPSYETSSNSDHNLHKIYNNFYNGTSFCPTYSQISNKPIDSKPPASTKSRYRYILPRPQFM